MIEMNSRNSNIETVNRGRSMGLELTDGLCFVLFRIKSIMNKLDEHPYNLDTYKTTNRCGDSFPTEHCNKRFYNPFIYINFKSIHLYLTLQKGNRAGKKTNST